MEVNTEESGGTARKTVKENSQELMELCTKANGKTGNIMVAVSLAHLMESNIRVCSRMVK
jgi:hypothetical protein